MAVASVQLYIELGCAHNAIPKVNEEPFAPQSIEIKAAIVTAIEAVATKIHTVDMCSVIEIKS